MQALPSTGHAAHYDPFSRCFRHERRRVQSRAGNALRSRVRWALYLGERRCAPVFRPQCSRYHFGRFTKTRCSSDDLQRAREERQRSLASGVSFEYENRLRRYRRPISLGSCPLSAAEGCSGTRSSRYGSATGIGDRERAEEALQRSEAYLAEAQRLSHSGSRAVKISTGEILPDGKTKYLYRTAHPVCNSSGDVTGFVGIIMDVTERERAEEERERLRQLETDRDPRTERTVESSAGGGGDAHRR